MGKMDSVDERVFCRFKLEYRNSIDGEWVEIYKYEKSRIGFYSESGIYQMTKFGLLYYKDRYCMKYLKLSGHYYLYEGDPVPHEWPYRYVEMFFDCDNGFPGQFTLTPGIYIYNVEDV